MILNFYLNYYSPTALVKHFGFDFQEINNRYTGTAENIIRQPYPVSTGLAHIGTIVTNRVARM